MKHPFDLTVIMYHYVRDPGDAAEAGTGIPGLPVREFETQLDELSKRYAFVTWPEVRAALQGGHPLPRSACLLTFDDGVRDHYINVFRILRNRNLSGLFFIIDRRNADGLILAHKIHFLLARLGIHKMREAIWEKLDSEERYLFRQAEKKNRLLAASVPIDEIDLLKAILQRDLSATADPLLGELFELYIGPEIKTARDYYLSPVQIREMAQGGMHFGGHSRNHPWFDWIDAGTRETEIQASAACLLGVESEPWAFAYPYGGLADDSPQLLHKNGFVAAFTTRAQVQHSDPYYIGRLDGEEILQFGGNHV